MPNFTNMVSFTEKLGDKYSVPEVKLFKFSHRTHDDEWVMYLDRYTDKLESVELGRFRATEEEAREKLAQLVDMLNTLKKEA